MAKVVSIVVRLSSMQTLLGLEIAGLALLWFLASIAPVSTSVLGDGRGEIV